MRLPELAVRLDLSSSSLLLVYALLLVAPSSFSLLLGWPQLLVAVGGCYLIVSVGWKLLIVGYLLVLLWMRSWIGPVPVLKTKVGWDLFRNKSPQFSLHCQHLLRLNHLLLKISLTHW